MTTYREPASNVSVVEQTDVIVAGSGPAGVVAAIAAARTGARTRLIEVHGCLGGVWTAGLLSWVIDAWDKPGIMAEITQRLEDRGARALRVKDGKCYTYDVEQMKLVLESMCLEAQVDVRLHTRVCAAARDEENRLAVVLTESKSGREAWQAKAFIDATGDGDLAAQVGCGFDFGHPETGAAQPMSLVALVTGIEFDRIEHFVGGGFSEPKVRLREEIRRGGVDPSYGGPTLFPVRKDTFALMANHQYGASPMDAGQLTRATLEARAEIHDIVNALRSLGEPWRDLRIVATAEQIGVREGRRIHGRYVVSLDDMIHGVRHEDGVCRSNFGVDVHALDPSASKVTMKENRTVRVQPYDIPLRALIAKDVDGLLLAGRCISGDFLAHSSYRVTGNAAMLGQAAGVAAALAATQNLLPHQVPWPLVKKHLDGLNRNHPALARSARVINASA